MSKSKKRHAARQRDNPPATTPPRKTASALSRLLPIIFTLTPLTASAGPAARFIPDAQGRELVPGGFVAITEDRKGAIRYTADDYRRMVRMGANFQVIRLSLGRLGGWPGDKPDPAYLAQLDDMVRMGREAGLTTVFKLVVYGISPFGPEQWDALWKNTGGSQDALLEAWKKIWTRYKDETSVFGYDLLNEPQRGLDPDEHRCVRESLLPTLRRLTDALKDVSPDKWAFYQPLFRDKGQGVGPFTPMTEPLGRDRVIYAPHMYTTDLKTMKETLDRYEREAGLGIGGIKAWFCGSRSPHENKKSKTEYTWAIFSDTSPVGQVERKYLVDPLARPRPLAVAGRLDDYGFDFATRTLKISLCPDVTLGATELFVSVDRFFPAGFQIEIGPGLVMALKPSDAKLHVVSAAKESDTRQAGLVRWDAERFHLTIEKWVQAPPRLEITIVPLSEQ